MLKYISVNVCCVERLTNDFSCLQVSHNYIPQKYIINSLNFEVIICKDDFFVYKTKMTCGEKTFSYWMMCHVSESPGHFWNGGGGINEANHESLTLSRAFQKSLLADERQNVFSCIQFVRNRFGRATSAYTDTIQKSPRHALAS